MLESQTVNKEQQSQPEHPSRQKTLELFQLLERLPLTEGQTIREFLDADKEEKLQGREIFNSQREDLIGRRQKGEFRSAYMKKFDTLMQAAETTEACKEFLTWEIERAYDKGVSGEIVAPKKTWDIRDDFIIHKRLPSSFAFVIFDYHDNPTSGGIFSKDDARDLELKIYNYALRDYDVLKMYMKLPSIVAKGSDLEQSPDELEEFINEGFLSISHMVTEIWNLTARGENIAEIRSNHETLFANWRRQMEWRYGITAHSEFSDDPKFLSSSDSEWTSLDGI